MRSVFVDGSQTRVIARRRVSAMKATCRASTVALSSSIAKRTHTCVS